MPETSISDGQRIPIPVPPGFPVEWDDDEEPQFLWSWDNFHSPLPRTPMTQSVSQYTSDGFKRAMKETGRYTPGGLRKIINGYPYSANRPYEPSAEEKARKEEMINTAIAEARGRWEREWRPQLERDLAEMKSVDLASLDDRELDSTVRRFLDLHCEHWHLHHLIVMPTITAADRLEARYVEVMGEQESPVTHRLLYGEETLTARAIQALDSLVDAAADEPKVRRVLEADGDWNKTSAALAGTEAGRVWLERLDSYLDEYGYRTAGFDLRFPTWREDPSFVLQNVRARLAAPKRESWAEKHETLLAQRDEMLAAVRTRLASDHEALAEFNRLYESAQSLWPLKEDHSHYIDQASTGLVRITLAEVGRRLSAKGVIERADDAWYLDLDEALSALDGQQPATMADAVKSRRADLERWSKLTPPRHLGSYPPDYTGEKYSTNDAVLNEARELRGTAASQGEATGTARIVMSPDDFHKIQPGDVLVCRSTAPMWTPLFEVISGLVSEAGGILSHPAVVAREFGLPAVVGVQGATGLIEDGSLVTVSGTDGIVRRSD